MPKAKKRKKETSDESDEVAGKCRLTWLSQFSLFEHLLDEPQVIVPLSTAANRAACSTCKSRKVKCEYAVGSSKCNRCINAGIEASCAAPPASSRQPARASSRRPSKAPNPSSAPPLSQKRPSSHSRSSQPSSAVPPKRSRSHSITSNTSLSSRISNRKPVPAARNLPIIDEDVEIEDASSHEDEDLEDDDLPQATIKSFGSAMVIAEAVRDADEDGAYEDEDSVVESDEEIIEFTSDIDDDPPARKRSIPAQKPAPPRKKPGPKPKRSRAKTPCSEDEAPDPKTCGENTSFSFRKRD